MGGIKEMTVVPDALVIVDVGYHKDCYSRS